MQIKEFLKPHRSWEDGVGLLLGLMIGLTPWFSSPPPVSAVVLNSALIGLAVLMLAQLVIVRMRRWEEIAELACGVWLFTAPFVLDYSNQDHLRLWHWALGGMVAALAAFELWQDWDVAGHGH